MKRLYFLISLLSMAYAGQAQVLIGNSDEPHPAAILELRAADKGLLLPVVSLIDYHSFFPQTDLADWKSAAGMLVFNNGKTSEVAHLSAGLYIWDGNRWHLIQTTALPSTIELADDPNNAPHSLVLGSK